MHLKHKTTLSLLLAVLLIVLVLWRATRPEPVTVTLRTVDRGVVEATVANTRAGTVMACQRARLSPSIGGQIAALPVKEGDRVEAGQLLMEMWNTDRRAEIKLAQREAVAADARAVEACTVAEVARREALRQAALKKKGLTSEEAVDRAEGDARARKAACEAARATAHVAAARVEVAQAGLERTLLRAPFAGTVAEINGELGEYVTPSPIGIATPPAVDLVDNSCLYVAAPIDEVDAPAIRAGMPARVTLDAFPGTSFPASVRRVAPYVMDREKQARTVDIEAAFAEGSALENLLPGYSADVEVILERRDNALRVPTEALLEDQRVLVYVDGVLHERKVRTGLSNWRYTEILDGLEAGERVTVSLDEDGVEDGALVVPRQEATP